MRARVFQFTIIAFIGTLTVGCDGWPGGGGGGGSWPPNPPIDTASHSQSDRIALFEDLVQKTLRREAFSPIKNSRLDIDYARDAEALRSTFRNANTDEKLYRALLKLSNVRKDRHLAIDEIDGGIDVRRYTLEVGIRFMPDFSDPDRTSLFVGDIASNASFDVLPQIGDTLVRIQGMDVGSYVEALAPYLRFSSHNKLLIEAASYASIYRSTFGEELYPDGAEQATFELERADGSRYVLTLDYEEPEDWQWANAMARTFPGFEQAFSTQSYDLYRHSAGRRVILLDWHGFKGDLRDDIETLVSYSDRERLWDHDVIIDATFSRGGSRSPDLIRHLTGERFKTTFGNIRISDILEPFTEMMKRYGSDTPLVRWLETEVANDAARGAAYSRNVPFKLAHLPANSDGYLQAASKHFRGRLVCLFFPKGGSQLDQFASMIIDNDLGHSIGMPTAGHSNTWEWEEDVHFPTSGDKAIRFMWNIGHTIRPYGEILEGNPAEHHERIVLTRHNATHYFDDLLRTALSHLE